MGELRCVFTDLDGSLLNEKHRIGETDLITIKTLKRRGIPVFLATGRHVSLTKDAAAAVGFDLPICACNGAHIYDFNAQKSLRTRAISPPVASRTFSILQELGLDYVIYTPERVVFRSKNGRYLHWETLNASFAPENRVAPHFVADGFDPNREVILKFLVRRDAPQALARELGALLGADAAFLGMSRSEAALLDINAAGTNKGEALRTLAERFGFRLEETMALGDSDNDIEMLRAAGIPVAPQNADASIKGLASYVTTDHTDSPLTHAMAHLFPALL
jgi:Cof subfamily protein (haloacid dehalogenase superfamily)